MAGKVNLTILFIDDDKNDFKLVKKYLKTPLIILLG